MSRLRTRARVAVSASTTTRRASDPRPSAASSAGVPAPPARPPRRRSTRRAVGERSVAVLLVSDPARQHVDVRRYRQAIALWPSGTGVPAIVATARARRTGRPRGRPASVRCRGWTRERVRARRMSTMRGSIIAGGL